MSTNLVGHSLGATPEILSGFDIMQCGLISRKLNISVSSFIVGYTVIVKEVKKMFEALPRLCHLQLVNVLDIISQHPKNILRFELVGDLHVKVSIYEGLEEP